MLREGVPSPINRVKIPINPAAKAAISTATCRKRTPSNHSRPLFPSSFSLLTSFLVFPLFILFLFCNFFLLLCFLNTFSQLIKKQGHILHFDAGSARMFMSPPISFNTLQGSFNKRSNHNALGTQTHLQLTSFFSSHHNNLIRKLVQELVGNLFGITAFFISVGVDKILVYTYTDKESSYTKEVSNELLYKFPNKIIVVGREKGGELKMSLRSKGIVIRPLVEAALQGVEGYGGGHEHACGACIKMKDVPLFLDQLRKGVEEAEKQKKVTK